MSKDARYEVTLVADPKFKQVTLTYAAEALSAALVDNLENDYGQLLPVGTKILIERVA